MLEGAKEIPPQCGPLSEPLCYYGIVISHSHSRLGDEGTCLVSFKLLASFPVIIEPC